MRYRTVAFVISFFGLLLLAVGSFTQKHALSFHRPAVGGEFRFSSNCTENAEALLVALSAAPSVFEGYDFGLGEAVRTISVDDCATWLRNNPSAPLIDTIQKRHEWAQSQFIDDAPPWLLAKFTEPPMSNAVFPSDVFGRLYLLLEHYRELNSGNGILHYVRCDYSLHLEPYRSFWASDLHSNNASEELLERITECEDLQIFDALISERLSEIKASG